MLNEIFELNSKASHFQTHVFMNLFQYEELTLEVYPRIFDTPCVQVKNKFTHKLSIL